MNHPLPQWASQGLTRGWWAVLFGCRQLVVSTQDGHLSFWDVDTIHGRIDLSDKVLHDSAQEGLCYVRHLDMVVSWAHDKGDFCLCGWDVPTRVRFMII